MEPESSSCPFCKSGSGAILASLNGGDDKITTTYECGTVYTDYLDNRMSCVRSETCHALTSDDVLTSEEVERIAKEIKKMCEEDNE